MNVTVFEITGGYAIASDSGQQLYDRIYPQLQQSNPVTLDFADVTVFASAFFNFAIGQLLRDMSPADLNHLVKIENLSDHGKPILKRVIDNAKQYYSDAQYQRAVDGALEEFAAG
ncbi:MAG: STAS-like domain-containing protein [Cyanobacteria bacterium J06626_23]